MSAKHSHNDQPTAQPCEFLGTEKFVDNIAKDIIQSDSPKTIAITGYWGSGKTSCLAGAYKKVTGKAPVEFSNSNTRRASQGECVGIWFEAWRYQHEKTPIVALLHCIQAHFSTDKQFINAAGKLASISILGALTVIDGVMKKASGLGGFDKLQAIGEKYEKDHLLTKLAPDQINDALTKAVQALIGDKKKKLVIFIDDLDRCEPEMAYKLLEGLKLYLNIPNCTVVMAIDQQQIERFLQKQFIELIPEQQEQAKKQYSYLGVEYLEKLCQEAYRLPMPSQEQKTQFFLQHLKMLNRGRNRNLVAELEVILQIYDCLPANPRRLKMITNRLADYLRKIEAGKLSRINEDDQFYAQFKYIEVPKRKELLMACVLIVSSLAVSYRRIYESVELRDDGAMDIFAFCSDADANIYGSSSSVFFELNKDHLSTTTQAKYEHPSDLSVFKLKPLFENETGIAEHCNTQPEVVSGIMHQLICHYNYH